jgi:hypothetical protein
VDGVIARMYLILLGRAISGGAYVFDWTMVAAFYFVL